LSCIFLSKYGVGIHFPNFLYFPLPVLFDLIIFFPTKNYNGSAVWGRGVQGASPPMPEIFKFQQFYMYFQVTFLKFSVKSENTWKFLLGKIAIKGLF